MCFWGGGGGGSTETQQVSTTQAAAPNPQPQPMPTETAPMETADRKRKKVEALRYGMLSTMKTSGAGMAGAGSDLQTTTPQATSGTKKTLGS